jgi:superfamily II DNA/RNA helicase
VIEALGAPARPRPVQSLALGGRRLLEHRRNVIVAAPTNAGKSLVGLLALLDAVRHARRAVLLTPLRAIAREIYANVHASRARLARALGRPLRVRLTTGDFRLDRETYASPPPGRGELVVATPERFDAILRDPGNAAWVEAVGCVCVDEAHLLSDPHRGPGLECLLTELICGAAPPRLVLLSASLGDLGRARAWLEPCDVARVTERRPPLRKEVWELDGKEEGEADRAVEAHARAVLSDPSSRLLVFVYQTVSAERLARTLRGPLEGRAGPDGPLPYHARLSPAARGANRGAFASGRCLCLVSTTALGLGVNLPATHVVVRDATFPGAGPVSAADLLQMMGRAGRDDREGHAVVLVRPGDPRGADELAALLHEERLPGLTSAFERLPPRKGRPDRPSPARARAAAPVLARLVRHAVRGQTLEDVRGFFQRSLGGRAVAGEVEGLLDWLCEPTRSLAYKDEHGRYRPTALGKSAATAMLPPDLAAGIGQLLRDLLTVDPRDRMLSRWQAPDHLIVLELLNPRTLPGRRFGEPLARRLDAWMQQQPAGSLLYREWIRGDTHTSRAGDLLGSLGIPPGESCDAARRTGYLAAVRAAILTERASGESGAAVERRWGVSGLEGADERWRDDVLWLLSGLVRLLEVRVFYFHLKEGCSADGERVRRVGRCFRRMRREALELRERLGHCSPLGSLLRELTASDGSRGAREVGARTLGRLEAAGVRTRADLERLTLSDLTHLKIRRPLAERIRAGLSRGQPGGA